MKIEELPLAIRNLPQPVRKFLGQQDITLAEQKKSTNQQIDLRRVLVDLAINQIYDYYDQLEARVDQNEIFYFLMRPLKSTEFIKPSSLDLIELNVLLTPQALAASYYNRALDLKDPQIREAYRKGIRHPETNPTKPKNRSFRLEIISKEDRLNLIYMDGPTNTLYTGIRIK